jgi:hypothetical protein
MMDRNEIERRVWMALEKSSLFQSIYGCLEEGQVERMAADITRYLTQEGLDIGEGRRREALDHISEYIGSELERANVEAECSDTDGLSLSIIFVYQEYLSDSSAIIDKISSRTAPLPGDTESESSS